MTISPPFPKYIGAPSSCHPHLLTGPSHHACLLCSICVLHSALLLHSRKHLWTPPRVLPLACRSSHANLDPVGEQTTHSSSTLAPPVSLLPTTRNINTRHQVNLQATFPRLLQVGNGAPPYVTSPSLADPNSVITPRFCVHPLVPRARAHPPTHRLHPPLSMMMLYPFPLCLVLPLANSSNLPPDPQAHLLCGLSLQPVLSRPIRTVCDRSHMDFACSVSLYPNLASLKKPMMMMTNMTTTTTHSRCTITTSRL
jgi:hypothetical protein